MHALVYGLAVAGTATVRALRRRGWTVTVADDRRDESVRAVAEELGVTLVTAPDDLDALLADADLLVPAPGVPEHHPVVTAAVRGAVPLASEIELAYRWEQERAGGPRPLLAVTGTDGKTTTTLLMVAMLEAAGLRAVAAGNTDVPLVDAIETDVDVFVVECTSFRLAWTERFRADAAIWLNLAEDHLDWHRSLDSYIAAKARVFELQTPADVAIGSAADPVVAAHLAAAPGRRLSFGLDTGDYRLHAGALVGPNGPIAEVGTLRRALPHDVTNALASAAAVLETGLASVEHVATALGSFAGPPHRIEHVADVDGVAWYDDSKATSPHAAGVAIAAFDHVVLIAGGRNKGLDLRPMAAMPERLRGVVAIGEAADDVAAVFAGGPTVVTAESMAAAVEQARRLALPGDTVLLSPGCASWDWYPEGGYAARGDHFAGLVRALATTDHEEGPT